MDKQQKLIISVLCAVLVLLLVFVSIWTVIHDKDSGPIILPFEAPEHDENAQKGTPELPDAKEIQYSSATVSAEYRVALALAPKKEGERVMIYLTSPESNRVRLLVKICDAEGNVLTESGLVDPGEYLPYLSLPSADVATEGLIAKIYAYEPETYYSMGSFDAPLSVKSAPTPQTPQTENGAESLKIQENTRFFTKNERFRFSSRESKPFLLNFYVLVGGRRI